MDALDERILGLDLIGFEGEPWPHGQVRYLYGQAFVAFLARRHGMKALGAFVEEYGRRVVPYGLNRALKRVTGETFVELYEVFKEELRVRAAATRMGVVTSGRVEGTRLTGHAELTRSPRFVSNDELVELLTKDHDADEQEIGRDLGPRERHEADARVVAQPVIVVTEHMRMQIAGRQHRQRAAQLVIALASGWRGACGKHQEASANQYDGTVRGQHRARSHGITWTMQAAIVGHIGFPGMTASPVLMTARRCGGDAAL